MQKYVKVVYDVYDLRIDGSADRMQKWERVPFCEENTEYDENVDYAENVRNFIFDCLNSQVVYMGEKYIPIHNVHGFHFDKENNQGLHVKDGVITELKPIQSPNNQNNRNNQNNQNNQNRRHNRFKKIKHRHDRPRANAETNLPFNVQKGEPITSTSSASILPSTPQLPER